MKRTRKLSAALALMLTVAVVAPSVNNGVDAAKAPKLSKTKLTLTVGSSKTISVKNYSKKVTWKTSKASVAKIKAAKKSCKITARKKGKANVTAVIKIGKKKKKLICKVTVKAKKPAVNPAATDNNAAVTPNVSVPTNAPAPTNVPADTPDPNATASPTPTFDYDGNAAEWKDGIPAIKDTFKDYFISGISTDKGSLMNGESASLVRYHFGSVTMGNENKMESTVSVDPTDEYPEGLSKANVDNYYKTKGEGKIILNYETLEDVLSYCKANNLKLRYHAFVWHAQVRPYFFIQDYNWSDYTLEDYETNGWDKENYHKLADKETMKKRLNDYISQVIEYIYAHGYGDVVYAYDVINEATNGQNGPVRYYVNENADSVDGILSTTSSGSSSLSFKTNNGVRTGGGGSVLTSDSSVEDVEKMFAYEGRGTKQDDSYWYSTLGPDYLYLSFLYTHDAIKANFEKYKEQYGYTVDPSLIYNDYNGNVSDHIALAKYINRACNLTNGTQNEKYCDGIGLQSHNVGESSQESQIRTVADAGFEVQITELDNNMDGDSLASRMGGLYKLYKKYSKNGEYGKAQGSDYIGVTSVTQWGIRDGDGSWGSGNIKYIFTEDPLPDDVWDEEKQEWVKQEAPTHRIHPKKALYTILQAGGVDVDKFLEKFN